MLLKIITLNIVSQVSIFNGEGGCVIDIVAVIFSHNLHSSYQVVLSYDFPYGIIIISSNF